MPHSNTDYGGKMKTKIKLVLTIQIIVLIVLATNLQAKNAVNIVTDEELSCIGLVQGRVGNSHGIYAWEPYIFAKVDAEVKQTRAGLLGVYHLFLPLNQKYNVTAYKSGFKPMTKEVTLTTEHPYRELNFDFFESEPVKNKENLKCVPYLQHLRLIQLFKIVFNLLAS